MDSNDKANKAWNAGARGECQPRYGNSDFNSRVKQDRAYREGVEHHEGMKKALWWLEPREKDYSSNREPREPLNMAFDETKEYTPLEKVLSLESFLTAIVVVLSAPAFFDHGLNFGVRIGVVVLGIAALVAIFTLIPKKYRK